MDPMFFQLDHVSLTYWRPVIDHLMTHDKMTFRDLMGEWFVACDFFFNPFRRYENLSSVNVAKLECR